MWSIVALFIFGQAFRTTVRHQLAFWEEAIGFVVADTEIQACVAGLTHVFVEDVLLDLSHHRLDFGAVAQAAGALAEHLHRRGNLLEQFLLVVSLDLDDESIFSTKLCFHE